MTISTQTRPNQVIKTVLNLSTRKRSFMVLLNPERIFRDDWNVEFGVFGVSWFDDDAKFAMKVSHTEFCL